MVLVFCIVFLLQFETYCCVAVLVGLEAGCNFTFINLHFNKSYKIVSDKFTPIAFEQTEDCFFFVFTLCSSRFLYILADS